MLEKKLNLVMRVWIRSFQCVEESIHFCIGRNVEPPPIFVVNTQVLDPLLQREPNEREVLTAFVTHVIFKFACRRAARVEGYAVNNTYQLNPRYE